MSLGTARERDDLDLLFTNNTTKDIGYDDLRDLVASSYNLINEPTIATFAALTISANTLIHGTGSAALTVVSYAANTFPARASTGNLVAKTITDFGLSLVDDADAATARSTLGLGTIATLTGSSGVYTPTLTNVANLDASTAYQCQYVRVGDVVTVSGKVDADPTAAGTVQLGISLPIASNFGAEEDCGGVAFAPGIAGQGAGIIADATNNRAEMKWTAVDLTNQAFSFSFTYRII